VCQQVGIRQSVSASRHKADAAILAVIVRGCVSFRLHKPLALLLVPRVCMKSACSQHTSEYFSIRPYASAYVSMQ
jgi:hypothetical protein